MPCHSFSLFNHFFLSENSFITSIYVFFFLSVKDTHVFLSPSPFTPHLKLCWSFEEDTPVILSPSPAPSPFELHMRTHRDDEKDAKDKVRVACWVCLSSDTEPHALLRCGCVGVEAPRGLLISNVQRRSQQSARVSAAGEKRVGVRGSGVQRANNHTLAKCCSG